MIDFGGGKIAVLASTMFQQVVDWLKNPGMKRFRCVGNGDIDRFAEDGETVIENW